MRNKRVSAQMLATIACVSALLLVACSNDAEPEAEAEQAQLLEAQTQALERARAVEDQLLDSAERTQRAIEEQTDGEHDAPPDET